MTIDDSRAITRRRGTLIAAATALIVGIALAVWAVSAQPDGNHPDLGDAPPASLAQGRTWDVTMLTSEGELTFSLDGVNAPQAAASFIHLAEEGFFEGTECHRLVTPSLLQCGDPTGTGTGGPGYSFGPVENAPRHDTYATGTVAMARVGGDGHSMGSQFFLVFDEVRLPSDTAGGYSVMGTINTGLELLQNISNAGTVDGSMDGKPLTRVIIESVEVT